MSSLEEAYAAHDPKLLAIESGPRVDRLRSKCRFKEVLRKVEDVWPGVRPSRYLVVGEENLAKVRPASTRVIDLVRFAEEAAIDPMYVEQPY